MRRIEYAIAWIGRAVSWLSLAMVLMMFLIVLLRHGFDRSQIAFSESVLWMNSILFLLGFAWTLQLDQHVRVDVFSRRWSPSQRALANVIGAILFTLPFCLFLIYISYDYVSAAWELREGSRESGGLPALYLFKSLIPLSAFLLALQTMCLLRRDYRVWRGFETPVAPSDTVVSSEHLA